MDINKHYNFNLYPIPLLGSTYKNAKLISILDYTTALKFENVEHLAKSALPYLPPNSPINHLNYTYYLFKINNNNVVIAQPWIIPESIEEVTSINYTLILNNISSTQLNIIKDQLRLLGVSFDIIE